MYLICIYVIGYEKNQILELFNMKLSKTMDQTRICKKSCDDPLGYFRGGSRGEGTRRAPPLPSPPKIGKNMIFLRKIVIFHTKYPNNFRASLRNWKEYDFLA
jgi:hypothetical protein